MILEHLQWFLGIRLSEEEILNQWEVAILSEGLFIAVFGFAVLAFGAWVAIQQRVDEPFELAYAAEKNGEIPALIDDEPLEATLIDESDGTSS